MSTRLLFGMKEKRKERIPHCTKSIYVESSTLLNTAVKRLNEEKRYGFAHSSSIFGKIWLSKFYFCLLSYVSGSGSFISGTRTNNLSMI